MEIYGHSSDALLVKKVDFNICMCKSLQVHNVDHFHVLRIIFKDVLILLWLDIATKTSMWNNCWTVYRCSLGRKNNFYLDDGHLAFSNNFFYLFVICNRCI